MLRYQTAGESHGPQVTAIVAGFPADVPMTQEEINRELARRQMGYGRGGRMKIEKDQVEFLSGIRFGRSMGSPLTLVIKNRDFENWREIMTPEPAPVDKEKVVTRPRPGHADLAGCLKYGHTDARNILERASARETAARVAVGAVCKCLLHEFGLDVFSHVVRICDVEAEVSELSYERIKELAETSDVRCADSAAAQKMRQKIDDARTRGDTVGGVVEIISTGVPAGLGDVMNSENKLDGLLAQSLMSIQSVKGVEIGMGFAAARIFGSDVHDAIYYSTDKDAFPTGHGSSGGFFHRTNNAGGIEGGMTNGEPVIVRAACKPIPTMMTPKSSVDLITKESFEASKERSDVCAVPAAAVVAEASVAFVLARAFLEKFGGDSLNEIRRNYDAYLEYLQQY
jgi:chorismate synthase